MTDTYIWQKIRQRLLNVIENYNTEFGKTTVLIEPNNTEERPINELWFEIFPLHTRPSQQELGTSGRNRWTLGLQININSPSGIGTYDIDEAYDYICASFKRGDIFDGIRVLQTADRSSARLQDDYYSVPVTVWVQADLDN